jgi:hypothetical protein
MRSGECAHAFARELDVEVRLAEHAMQPFADIDGSRDNAVWAFEKSDKMNNFGISHA